MGQIKFIGSLLMVAVFAVSLSIFAVQFAIDNDAAFSLADAEGFDETSLGIQNNLSKWQTEVVSSSDAFYESEISEGETVQTGGQFKLGPSTAYDTVQTMLSQGFRSIFGNGPNFAFIFTTLIAFLGLVIILYIWKTWAGRNPD